MKSKNFFRTLSVGLIVLLMLALIGGSIANAGGPADPTPGKVSGWATYYFYGPTNVITVAGTISTGSPLLRGGADVSRFLKNTSTWNSADVFLTADVSGTAAITVTPQMSADGVNWVNASYSYLSDSFATSVITSTGLLTATTAQVTSIATGNYQKVLTTDSTVFYALPLSGLYMRFQMETTGTLTPTIQVVFKNN